MEQYLIHEANIGRLEKRIETIHNKCIKYGVEFTYRRVGEEFKTYTNEAGQENTVRYIVVEVEGEVKHNNWEFIASIDHQEYGNVIRQFNHDIEVPVKYLTTDGICEHCNTRRKRKTTCLLHNTETDEWKQVGKSCLKEFTDGLDAEGVAKYISLFEELIKGEAPTSGYGAYYYDLKTMLLYATECVRVIGYWRTDSDRSTVVRALDYWRLSRNEIRPDSVADKYKQEIEDLGFNVDREENKEFVDNAIEWARNVDVQGNSYLNNLQVICSDEYVEGKNLGILMSLVPTYNRESKSLEEKEKEQSEAQKEIENSEYIGEVGERITVNITDVEHLFTSESIYGLSYLYKFHDEDGNVLIWWTGLLIDTEAEDFQCPKTITGRVKDHSEYKQLKQTVLTRCKLA